MSNLKKIIMSGVKEKKRFIITVAKKFLAYHTKAGESTDFAFKITTGKKIHTIRPNYEGWLKKFKEIDSGKGNLIVNQWSGLPYRSQQETIEELSNEHGVGVSKLTYKEGEGLFVNDTIPVTLEEIAENDGLSVDDFKDWFKVFPTEPMAIIHLNSFRYGDLEENKRI